MVFDVDDELAAQREARRRWIATDPVAAASVGPLAEFIDAWNERDRTRVRATLANDLVVEDHRRTGMGRIDGADAYVDSIVALWRLAPDSQIETSLFVVERYGAVGVGRRSGRLAEGGAFESDFIVMSAVECGLTTRIEMFEVDSLDAALARFGELRPDPLRIPPNAAFRGTARMSEAYVARDWAALRANASDDFVYEDRGKRALVSGDVETWLASIQFVASKPEAAIEFDLIGTVGDRIELERFIWAGGPDADTFEIECIRVGEVNADGQLRASILFDPDDRGAAFGEALDRFVAGEAAAIGGQAPYAAFNRAFRQHDWEAVRRAMAPDFVLVDHRTLGLGTLDRDQWVASFRAQADLAPDVTAEVFRVLSWNRHGLVAMARTCGTVPDGGGPFENAFINVVLTDGDRIQRFEVFAVADAEQALARFAELSGEERR